MWAKKSLAKNNISLFKTWIELNRDAAQNNCLLFRKIINKNTKLFAVVKSNAYGHGIFDFPKIINSYINGFCVDSVIEAQKLRQVNIKKDILVLGATLKELYPLALNANVYITISNWEALNNYLKSKYKPKIHLKCDTGMNRQGFKLEDIFKVIKLITKYKNNINLKGIYTHFASSSNPLYKNYTEKQFNAFQKIIYLFKKNGFNNLTYHCAATSAALINKKYHLNACRIGMGLYGYFPSKKLEKYFKNKINLKPVLSWKTIISEIKFLKKNEFVGYDLTFKTKRPIKLALIPIGYWHGLSRKLSNKGFVLINGREAKILGKISMDITAVDVSNINTQVGDKVILIGKSKNKMIDAIKIGSLAGSNHYEFLTRLNPLIQKITI